MSDFTLRDFDEMPDDEFDALFDATMRAMLEQAREDLKKKPEPFVRIMDPNAVQDVLFVYKLMQEMTKGTDAKVFCEFDEKCGSAAVYVKTVSFVAQDSAAFLVATEKMPGFFASASTDGTIDFTFTKWHIMKEYDKDGNEIK